MLWRVIETVAIMILIYTDPEYKRFHCFKHVFNLNKVLFHYKE